ncbi:MAG: IS1634 family transposase, partial [Clostridia bacterium]|nr:IS1634 family transposase [Clostridia bacterium]
SRTLVFDDRKELKETSSSFRNIGYLALKPILNRLRLDLPCAALQEKHACEHSIDDVLSFLVYSQIINPVSKISSYHKIGQFFENYRFSEDQMYRTLSYLGDAFESIKDYAYRMTEETYGLNTDTTYYDGTNFYFEIDREDDFRRKGPSKENRVSPLVSIGLLLDKDHIPIDVKIYPGNESEKSHFTSVINEMKAKNKIKGRTIYVADKGLNCGNNIIEAIRNNDGYIYSQTVKGSSGMMKLYIENDHGFTPVFDRFGEIEYQIKGFVHDVEIPFDHEGKKLKHKMKQLQVVTWSRNYAEKTRHEREKLIGKAKALINSPSAFDKEKIGNAANYLKKISYDKNGKVITSTSELILDQEKIDQEARLDGFYLIVTSETGMKPVDVLKAYRGLSHIEETFRVAKLFLKIRPVYLQRAERIKAHVLVCYLSLLILRIMETKVLKHTFSFEEIIHSLRDYNCAMIKPDNYFLFSYNPLVLELSKHSDGNPKLEIQSLGQIKTLFKNY